jgi:hypothetical protein
MHKLEKDFYDQIRKALIRKSVVSCSSWAENYRVMGGERPGPWRFSRHPWLKVPHNWKDEYQVYQKAAQMGFTELGLNKTFYFIDIKGASVLYVLPTKHPDATDFSTSRFGPALQMSPHLRNLFSDVSNVGHKRAGSANLFVRGSRTRSAMKSLPVSMIVFDELDEMDQENVILAEERTSGQEERQILKISTPTFEKVGINAAFHLSSQHYYSFKCPHCGRFTVLDYPDSLVIPTDDATSTKLYESYYICKLCKKRLEHDLKGTYLCDGEWVPTYTDRIIKGATINQFYSFVRKPWELALICLQGRSDPTAEQEFYNSKLGMVHTVEGAGITDADLRDCESKSHRMDIKYKPCSMTVMGVDVGIKKIHISVEEVFQKKSGISHDPNLSTKTKLIWAGTVDQFEELDSYMQHFRIAFCVVDSNPERRKAIEFAQRFEGRVKLCYYIQGNSGKYVTASDESYVVQVHRTAWFDLAFSRIRRHDIILPYNLSEEYKRHIKVPIRHYGRDPMGNPTGRYLSGKDDDHFAHTRLYAELAIMFASGKGVSQDIPAGSL